MTQQIIGTGSAPNDGTGDPARTAFTKVNSNFTDLYAGNANFVQSGAGAVTRTQTAKLKESVSVKDFGAVGDGVTDDTAAVQAFLNACQDKRGYMPPGIYKITSALTLQPQYSYNIEGATYDNSGVTGTVIYNAGTGNAIYITNEPFTTNYDSQIRFANLTVKGNASSLNGFYVQHCMIFLENVWSINNGTNGMYLERGYSSSFRQAVFANNGQNGLQINRAANAIHFDHCIFNGNGTAGGGYAGCNISGAVADYNYGMAFSACDFTGNGNSSASGYGCIVQYARGANFVGCYFENNKTYNMYGDSTTNNLNVIGCYFQDSNTSLVGIDGLAYLNNTHQYVINATGVTITGGMPSSRLRTYVYGNTYMGGATSSITAGASENIETFYSSAPSGGTWLRGDIVWNNTAGSGGATVGWVCTVPGTPGTWLPLNQIPYTYANVGDADITLTPYSSFTTNLYQSPITANRNVTLSTTGATSGIRFRVVRTAGATGAFSVNVGSGPLKALSSGQWCDVEYTGSTWMLVAFGSL